MGKQDTPSLTPVNLAGGDICRELVPSPKGEGLFEKRVYIRVELVYKKGIYNLFLYTKTERISIVALRTSKLRKWANVDSALDFIKQHVGPQPVIFLLYP